MPSHAVRAGLAALSVLASASALATPRSVPTTRADALVGGHVIVAPGREIEDATVVLRDGLIVAVGPSKDVAVPVDARRWDVSGRTLWAGLVDPWIGLSRINAIPDPKPAGGDDAPAGEDAAKKSDSAGPIPARRSASGSDNPLVHGEVRVTDVLAPDAKALDALRSQGFAAASVVPDRGIVRGRGAVVSLRSGTPGELVIREGDDLHVAFETRVDLYPDSVMGATAVIRQSLLDGDWYRRARRATANGPQRVDEDASLQAIALFLPEKGDRRARGRIAFACKDVLDDLRAGAVASEFSLPLLLRGAGDEYRRVDEIVALKAPIVLPVTQPAPPDAIDESEWQEVPLETLRHWQRAPDNARWLDEAGVDVSLTTDGLKDVADFTKRVQRSIELGLAPDRALEMTTIRPARILGLSDRLGTIEKGRIANVVVARGRPFAKGTQIRDVWVDGRRQVVSREPDGPLGDWTATLHVGGVAHAGRLKLASKDGKFTLDGPAPAAGAKVEKVKSAVSAVVLDGSHVRFELEGKPFGREGTVAFAGEVTDSGELLKATAADASVTLQGRRSRDPEPEEDANAKPTTPAPPPGHVGGPLDASSDVLLADATVWTCGPLGILEHADVLVRGGKIAAVGQAVTRPDGVRVISCSGKAVTPGMIDAHNHSAIVGGVNEGTDSCTAQVRIGDVVNSETVDIYRQLAGGTTAVNLLHGSANCMGGQSQVIKLRWGAPPEGLKFREATPAIKFALGENVKQSNWGEKYVTRFPQTRMGVEQFMRDKFQQAHDWAEASRPGAVAAGGIPPRRDLQLECLDQILRGERKVHCHSYRQDEILMLMRVAEDFGFRVGTFQHILEGYKVADEMAKHGAMASSFTDWWGYKIEVQDAIPYNPSLMRDRGVVVSVNSDSTELARRMNFEASKVAKWGDVPREEALHFVTINPARQLGVDGVTGSIEVGKSADLVTWSGDPLSTGSRAEQVRVDGLLYFDRERDVAARTARAAERATLVAAARKAREQDGVTGEPFNPSYLGVNIGCMDGIGGDGIDAHASGEVQ